MFGEPLPDAPEFESGRIAGDDLVQQARDRARQGDWQAARYALVDAGDDWEVRGRRVDVLSEAAAEDDRWLTAWLRDAPSDPGAVLLEAAQLNQRAWTARGGASAANTSPEQFRDFARLSSAAAEVGRQAMALAGPDDPVPWAEMLSTMYASRSVYETSFGEVFAEGRRRDPVNFGLHHAAVGLRCAKWYGSHDLMFATAREVAGAAPPGAAAVLLPLSAHFQYALREFAWGTDRDRSRKLVRRYFREPEVRREVDGWAARWQAGTPGPARLGTCRQWLAVYYTLLGLRPEAKAQFDALGTHVRPATVWSWFWGERRYGYLRSWWWANGV